jgi:hypothetical protein
VELLDRYLKSVRTHLPEGQKDDIIRELEEHLRSQIEEQEKQLGRPLTDAESEAILKAHGHPLIVAGRYRQDGGTFAFGKQWIGPALFPFYWKVLKFNLGITGVVLLLVYVALVATGQRVGLIGGLPSVILWQLVSQFTVITAIFIGVDRNLTKHPDNWDPRSPEKAYHPGLTDPETLGPPRVPRADSTARLVALGVWILWLRAIRNIPFLVFGPAAAYLKAAPVWHQVYWPIIGLAFTGMIQAAINLFRPQWTWLRTAERLFMGVAALVLWGYVLNAGQWILADPEKVSPHTLDIINQSIFYSLVVALLIAAAQLLRDVYRTMRGTPNSPSMHAA